MMQLSSVLMLFWRRKFIKTNLVMNFRRVVKPLGLLLACCSFYFLVTLFQVWNVGRSDQQQPVDAIVVLGAAQYDGRPSPQLQARLDHAYKLWNLNLAPYIVVTGGKQSGDRFTEAQAGRKFFTSLGVKRDLIIQENLGRSTYESLVEVSRIAKNVGMKRILIVSDPFHELRAKLIAQEVGLVAFVSPTRSGVVHGSTAFKHNIQEAIGVAVGRIVGFQRVDLWVN